jgi:hypothetical protein
MAMSNGQPTETTDKHYGFWIIIAGFLVVLLVFVVAVLKWPEAKDVTAAVGAVTGTVGTLAGAYFGVHAGAAGKEKVEQQRDAAQAKVEKLAALMDPSIAARALNVPQ